MWQRATSGGRVSLDKFWGWKPWSPTTENPKKNSSEAFWPTTLDKECDKAARIIRSFSKDGFASAESNGAIKRIPKDVIQNASGLVIFTTMRSGLWISGAGGSGVLLAKLPNGSWSPPSAILLHTDDVSFLVDIDMYDGIFVLNSSSALDALSAERYTIGSDLRVMTGPVATGDISDVDLMQSPTPILTYLKSQRKQIEMQLVGAVVVERVDENERFYQRQIRSSDIISGRIIKTPWEANRLIHTIKAAQGDTDVDPSMLPLETSPSDMDLADGMFGVPAKDDPDPFGVLALEKEGFVLREAGSKKLANRESFNFQPSPSSPLFNAFNRGEVPTPTSIRSSWRTSATIRSLSVSDMATQTNEDLPPLPPSRPESPTNSTFRLDLNIPSIGQTLTQGPRKNSLDALNQALGSFTSKSSFAASELDFFNTVELESSSKPRQSAYQLPLDTNSSDLVQVMYPTSGEQQLPLQNNVFVQMDAEKAVLDNIEITPIEHQLGVSDAHNQDVDAESDYEDAMVENVKGVDEDSLTGAEADDEDEDDENDEDDDDDDEENDEEDEDMEMVVEIVQQQPATRIITALPQLITKAKLVTVPKLPPAPALPSRNPNRSISVPRSAPPTQTTFNFTTFTDSKLEEIEEIQRPSTSGNDHVTALPDEDDRQASSAASSVYSLKREEPTDSLGSVSSVDDNERRKEEALNKNNGDSPYINNGFSVDPWTQTGVQMG